MSVRSESSSRSADAGAFLVALAAGVVLLAVSWGVLHLGPFHRYQIIDTPVYQDYGEAIAAGQVPYRDFDLEYPPGALPVFWLPTLGPAEHYASLFETLMAICAVAMLVLVLRALVSLDATPTRLLAVAVLLGLFPLALGSVVLSRYDLWPAALTVAALAAVLARRERLGLAILGLAVTAKIYPLVLLPPLLVYVARRRGGREAAVGFGFFAVALALVALPFLVASPDGLVDSLQRQLDRPLQIESLGASVLLVAHQLGVYDPTVVSTFGSQNLEGSLPDALALAQTLVQVIALVAVWLLFARGPATPERLVVACAGSVVVFVAFGKVLSPQFLIWLVPLVLLAAGWTGLTVAALLGAALVTTHLWFPTRYWDVVALEPAGWLVLARNVLLVALAAVLVAATTERARAGPRSW